MTVVDSGTPVRGTVEESGFVVRLESYSGPLDLLLHLLREERIDIADIPIARIADQFLAIIHSLGLNQAADYLDLAGRLVRLKVQMLLPRSGEGDDWVDPRAELVRRLLEYQQIKEIALWFDQAAGERGTRFARGYLPDPPAVPPPPLELDLLELLNAVERAIAGILHPVMHSVVARPLDVEGATARILSLLEDHEVFDWRQALGERPSIIDVLSTFLALLELARRGIVRVAQATPFASLVVTRDPSCPTD